MTTTKSATCADCGRELTPANAAGTPVTVLTGTAANPREVCRACWQAGRPVAPKPPALHVGDPVEWRGGFGTQPPMIATVSGIEQTAGPGQKYGTDVTELAWPDVLAGFAVVSLTNGHWCYGHQLRPAPGMAAAVALARWEADAPTRRAHELATAGPLDPRD